MKKAISLLLCLLLALCSLPAMAGRYEVTGLFSVDCGSYRIDSSQYLGEPDWLFMIYDSTALIDAYRSDERVYDPSLTLVDPDLETLRAFQNQLTDLLQDSAPEYQRTVQCENGVTFLMYIVRDELGTYVMAETAVQGYAIYFTAVYRDDSPADCLLCDELEKLLLSYRPVI